MTRLILPWLGVELNFFGYVVVVAIINNDRHLHKRANRHPCVQSQGSCENPEKVYEDAISVKNIFQAQNRLNCN